MMKDEKGRPCLAIIVPCYNEAAVLNQTARRLLAVVEGMRDTVSPESRILFIDDGSSDATWDMIVRLHDAHRSIAGISLSHNSGHQNALVAGLHTAAAFCDYAVSIDADLQDDETVIPEMLRLAQQGNDIVCGVRSSRTTDTWFKRTSAQTFYRMMKHMGVETVYNHADFRLMSRRAIEALLRYEERNLFLRGLVPLLGYRTAQVEYARSEREAGESKYPVGKMIALAFDGITSFSMTPLHLVFWLGVSFLAVALGMSLWAAGCLVLKKAVTGWTSLMLSLWLIGGCVLISLGVIGEYIGKIYMEVKQRPRYNIKDERL